mmetsp:Transcript_69453/g.166499  ORF Transcript_69453/g.166499 Transcript_69453/m.166499 type:complete len:122 (+) Transcript_69453:86-451(+)|eukprot:CAMPEP_0178377736 /NCGR_PEP_ID=MMETSP0689_2-20121128/4070_1 /TAXON_ID=160604 /ORGANISM="Amphidinium massartii, Strain CS-259" /LENGTH=121 /DNA_ID=CAMNT_0019997795 /DNA_START=53 /DNA_END=418 /DNA_ORIENTATION=+
MAQTVTSGSAESTTESQSGFFGSFFQSKEQDAAEEYGRHLLLMCGILERHARGEVQKQDARGQCWTLMEKMRSCGKVDNARVDAYLLSNSVDANKRLWMKDQYEQVMQVTCWESFTSHLTC